MFLLVDLFAAAVNALNGGLLGMRSDHYKGKYFTVVGILVLAIMGGIGGGVTRDVLLNDIPSALSNPWYLILCVLAWLVALRIAYTKGQKFRETLFQFFTAFSLPWYAVVGVEKGLAADWPIIGAIFLGVVGPTAGRYLIDITCGKSAKQLVRGEWFVGTAVLTSVVYFLLRGGAYGDFGLSLSFAAATILAFLVGFTFRLVSQWFAWEEPMPKVPRILLQGLPKKVPLRDKMQPGWTPDD